MTQALAQARKALHGIRQTADGMNRRGGLGYGNHDNLEAIIRVADAALAAIDAALEGGAPDDEPGWQMIDVVPNINRGQEKQFVVAVRRARTGKVHTFPAYYLNAYPIHYEDGCKDCPGEGKGCREGDGDGCPTTGWFTCMEGGEYDYMYHHLHLDPGDEHVAWREFPQYLPSPPTGA